ncbi:uncharacterized protein LOC109714981 [Ananas comosus]|uniref:Uncharacterized protein LOC109714981 n=1 Tax=Ananas comosus TaxID=4615 RepID=A0A6P5FHE2_ANACO|nr:uncharacterized protein LOC109714981 [Ananas comosus]
MVDPSTKPSEPLMLASGVSGRLSALVSLLLLLRAAVLFVLLPFRRWPRFVPSSSSPSSAAAAAATGEEGAAVSTSGGGGGGKKGGAAAATVVVRVPAAMVAKRRQREQEAAARRAAAVRRVRVAAEREEREEGRCRRDFALMGTARGETLFTQSWAPLNVKTKGLVVLLHGLNEHSGRYDHFARKLNDHGFKVHAMDWIGHGGSDGLHGYVQSLDYAVSDLKAFLERVLSENPSLPCFCFGHSTGAAIILKAVLDPKVEALVKGVVLTSPAIHVQPTHPIVAVLAPVISLIAPKYQFAAANRNGLSVSRDPEALRSKYSDPLVFTGAIRVRTGYEILRMSTYLQQNLSRINTPFLILHGTADLVTDPEGSQKLYEEAASSDKSIKLYEGLLHDLLIEPEREIVMRDIIDWLNSRV